MVRGIGFGFAAAASACADDERGASSATTSASDSAKSDGEHDGLVRFKATPRSGRAAVRETIAKARRVNALDRSRPIRQAGAVHPRVEELIERLELAPHPEGGFYRETFRSHLAVDPQDGRFSRS